jgi:hypothetical protein
MATNDNFERLDKFLKGGLSESERQNLRQALRERKDLRAELLRHRLADRAVELAKEDRLRAQLDAIKDKHGLPADPSPARVIRFGAMARAAAILLLAVCSFVFWGRQQYSDKALIAQAHVEMSTPSERSRDLSSQALDEGFDAYFGKKDYALAIERFAAVPTDDSLYIEAQYGLAHAYLSQGNHTAAAERFAWLSEQPVDLLANFVDREALAWNYLLARLGAGASLDSLQEQFDAFRVKKDYRDKVERLEKQLRHPLRRLTPR